MTKPVAPAMLADTDLLFTLAREGCEQYQQAEPFAHHLLPHLIKPVCGSALFEGFVEAATNTQEPDTLFTQLELPAVVRMLVWELASSTLIRHFASLSGTPPLLPDPFFVNSGINLWCEAEMQFNASEALLERHPKTDLLNVLRVELFVSADPEATFELAYLNDAGEAVSVEQVKSSMALLSDSQRYHLRYTTDTPQNWASFVAYYYINDRARQLTGELPEDSTGGGY